MKSDKRRLLGLALVPFLASACTQEMAEEYYLPCHYTGWVNIIYGPTGPSRVVTTDRQRVFILTGNLPYCYVNVEPRKSNYTTAYYRYCDTGITGPQSPLRDKTYVLDMYYSFVTIHGKKYSVDSFFVSDKPLGKGVSRDTLPPNPLPYSMPAQVQ